jgi:hypothetical protein
MERFRAVALILVSAHVHSGPRGRAGEENNDRKSGTYLARSAPESFLVILKAKESLTHGETLSSGDKC